MQNLPTEESLYWEALQVAYMRLCQDPSDYNRSVYHNMHSQWARVFGAYYAGDVPPVKVQ